MFNRVKFTVNVDCAYKSFHLQPLSSKKFSIEDFLCENDMEASSRSQLHNQFSSNSKVVVKNLTSVKMFILMGILFKCLSY